MWHSICLTLLERRVYCFFVCVFHFEKTTRSFGKLVLLLFLSWLEFFKKLTPYNMGLRLITLRSRIPRSTDWASQAPLEDCFFHTQRAHVLVAMGGRGMEAFYVGKWEDYEADLSIGIWGSYYVERTISPKVLVEGHLMGFLQIQSQRVTPSGDCWSSSTVWKQVSGTLKDLWCCLAHL